MLIEIEGIDGAGKTTQCRLLKNWFECKGEKAIVVKDLESTQLGRQIKSIFVTDMPRAKEVELFGFLCCKAHLFFEIILPELKSGTHVICDRGTGSFLSYFEVLGFDKTFLTSSLSIALIGEYKPVTFLIDLEVQVALRRNVAKPTYSKFDNMGSAFFNSQRQVYAELAEINHWTIIEGTSSIEDVHQSILSSVTKL